MVLCGERKHRSKAGRTEDHPKNGRQPDGTERCSSCLCDPRHRRCSPSFPVRSGGGHGGSLRCPVSHQETCGWPCGSTGARQSIRGTWDEDGRTASAGCGVPLSLIGAAGSDGHRFAGREAESETWHGSKSHQRGSGKLVRRSASRGLQADHFLQCDFRTSCSWLSKVLNRHLQRICDATDGRSSGTKAYLAQAANI